MSKLLVNEIAPKSGSTVSITGFSDGSNIKEQLAMLCDGGTYTVPSGTYTAENVTAVMNLTTTYADLTGSKVTYTPPSGTTSVIYEFWWHTAGVDNYPLSNNKLFIDGTEVTAARTSIGGTYADLQCTFKWVIPIGGSASAATGRQATWTSPKELKLQAREQGASNTMKYHKTQSFEGSNSASNQIVLTPVLIITSIG